MPASCGVLGKEDVARVQHEVRTRARLEVERAAECDDELAGRRVVPFEGATGSSLAERDADDVGRTAENVAAFALGKVNDTLLEIRVVVLSSPKPDTAYH